MFALHFSLYCTVELNRGYSGLFRFGLNNLVPRVLSYLSLRSKREGRREIMGTRLWFERSLPFAHIRLLKVMTRDIDPHGWLG